MELIDGAIWREAGKRHVCAGDGAAPPTFAPGCEGIIEAGRDHVEYVGETPAFQSGSRHCAACGLAYYTEGTD